MLTICDVVLNHTANESQWLQEHPECTYNLINSPYLKAAYLLDITLHNFSLEVGNGVWELNGVPKLICTEEHLGALRYVLQDIILPKVKIQELFLVPVDELVSDFLTKCRTFPPPDGVKLDAALPKLKVIQDPLYRRMKSTVNMTLALKRYNIFRNDCFDEETRIQKCASEFKTRLEILNRDSNDQTQMHLMAAVDNVIAGVRYFRVESSGPRLQEITTEAPLFTRYFADFNNEPSEEHAYTENGIFIMAHNGWIMNADPLKNFAESDSQVYLRRELIAWGDSVKLRYGDKPEDCPYLWNRMREYVEQTVRAFDGVRLDNCHSTPIHVAEYLLDAARLIRPNLYVVAELFTNSDLTDNIFVNRLGITSLIRESMSAWDLRELGRLVHRYGGEPVGAFIKPLSRPLTANVAHALFLDLTHDNPSPIEKRSVYDLLPTSALVSMACCATGSSMGYDQLVPHHIHVVEETRTYPEWGLQINESDGIIAGKRSLNELHNYLGINGYDQIFVDQVDSDIICVTRRNSVTHESVILGSYSTFCNPNPFATAEGKGVTVTGCVETVLIEAYLTHKSESRYSTQTQFTKDSWIINGLSEYKLMIKKNISATDTSMVQLVKESENTTRVNFTNQFKPGCVVAIKFVQTPEVLEALRKLSECPPLEFRTAEELSLADMNRVFYSCEGENGSVYQVPNFIPFVYCGLQGVISFMDAIAVNNDLGHPICDNLREGNWLIDYTVFRLQSNPRTKKLAGWLEELFRPIKDIPRYLVPCYFYFIISQVYVELLKYTLSLMPKTINEASEFTKLLALGSVQFGGIVESSPLPPLSKKINPPVPPVAADTQTPLCVSLSAGLPHFAVGYTRNWGRDTFIALRGLFLLTGRFDEARYIILAYAGCLRHGLIPNLLDGGRNARYNCRDAVWWWLYTIKHYVASVPNGTNILNDTVNRLYPSDDSSLNSVDQPLHDVIQESMTKHFQGVCFRERNAGSAIDTHMKSVGFDNQIGVHPVTGFVFGGNEWNCGTWMDKMGSSDKAGNRGQPATPRDGSPIEIVALCKSAISWLAQMYEQGFYPYEGVQRKNNSNGSETYWKYAEWAVKIHNNFEKHFWIPSDPATNEEHPNLIHRREIYKDCYGATQTWTNYQLRCNYSVAMVIAPELFTPKNAWIALETARLLLVGPLGMKTLDPADWAYNGVYDNRDDSSDPKIAHGFNYHQGPEWLWPVGYFIRARLYFASKLKDRFLVEKVLSECKSYLANHYTHLRNSDWSGLPELTNKDGAYCSFSCPTQAWSMSSILEAVNDIVSIDMEESFN